MVDGPKEDPLFTELREHVFGLGLISLRYNVFESSLRFILANYVEPAAVDLLFEKASNEQRALAIRTLAKRKEDDRQVLDHIDHLLKFFSICAENRNVLMHSAEAWTFEAEKGSMGLEKRLKQGGKNIYQLDLPALIRINNDIVAGISYLMEVDKLSEPSSKERHATLASLGKPPLPSTLNPHRPVVNLQAGPSQPEPS